MRTTLHSHQGSLFTPGIQSFWKQISLSVFRTWKNPTKIGLRQTGLHAHRAHASWNANCRRCLPTPGTPSSFALLTISVFVGHCLLIKYTAHKEQVFSLFICKWISTFWNSAWHILDHQCMSLGWINNKIDTPSFFSSKSNFIGKSTSDYISKIWFWDFCNKLFPRSATLGKSSLPLTHILASRTQPSVDHTPCFTQDWQEAACDPSTSGKLMHEDLKLEPSLGNLVSEALS